MKFSYSFIFPLLFVLTTACSTFSLNGKSDFLSFNDVEKLKFEKLTKVQARRQVGEPHEIVKLKKNEEKMLHRTIRVPIWQV